MLSSGVDRVVDQVVNPKIYTDFKPQIDRIVCDQLGLDYERWLARLSMRFDFSFLWLIDYYELILPCAKFLLIA